MVYGVVIILSKKKEKDEEEEEDVGEGEKCLAHSNIISFFFR
jgi:hypothetical protein